MLIISTVLGQLIKDYFEHSLTSGRDCRMIVPGLTSKISFELQEFLTGEGITTYLVIGEGLTPDKKKLWLRPVGLTSKRIGSFISITFPGQLSHIQDSIRGSGGAIRSIAYSEEWPWIDDGNEHFRFRGPVLEKLVLMYTKEYNYQEWLKEFIFYCLLKNTQSCSGRANILLENILGKFNPILYPDIDDIRLKILFHSGIPRPVNDISSIKKIIHNTSNLCNRINEHCKKEDGARQQAVDTVPKVVPVDEVDITTRSLNVFLDGLGRSETIDLGPLSFFNCWGNNPQYWHNLDALRLEKLFEIEQRQPAELTCNVECDRSIISSQGDTIATFHREEFLLSGNYKIPVEEINEFSWTLQLNYRQKNIQTINVDSTEGSYCFLLETAKQFTRYKSGLTLRVNLIADTDLRAEARIKVHLCGPERPNFTVVEKGFYVIDANLRDEDEPPDKKIISNEPTHLFLFSESCKQPSLIDLDENEHTIIDTGIEGIWRTGIRLDPLEDVTGQIIRISQFDELISLICFEAKDTERGEFTIEDELRSSIVNDRGQKIKELISLFSGESNDPFRRLGKINESTRRLILLANDQTNERGWRPEIIDFFGNEYDETGFIGDYVGFRGNIDAPAFKNLKLPGDAIELIRNYSSLRYSIIERIRNNINIAGYPLDHPLYASHPIYVYSIRKELSELLIHYSNAYRNLINYIKTNYNDLEWSQLFVLIYLDCIVQWDDSALKNSFFLIGPWHPLILAKRYMVQNSLYYRAKGLNEENGKLFRHLTIMLKEIKGFSWFIGLHRNDRLLEPLFVSPTSDPGWHFAMKQDLPVIAIQSQQTSLLGILECIKERLGLQSHILRGNTEDLAASGLANFMKAFPARRTLGLRIRKGYSTGEIVKSIDNFLHDEDKASEKGLQLPGGVHLFNEEPFGYIDGINWSKPPIHIYLCESDEDCFKDNTPDIYLLAPTRNISFRPATENYGQARGLGFLSVFSEPMCWITEGQAQLPNSISLEYDVEDNYENDLGGNFVNTAASICKVLQNHAVMVRTVDLPQSLDCPWAIIPGGEIDPAVFVKYVRDGANRSIQDRALWDYRIDISGSKNSYYILSTIPKGFAVAVNGFFNKENVANKFLEDLGNLRYFHRWRGS